jgi:tetratricopeptide (TPR) repeat protein
MQWTLVLLLAFALSGCGSTPKQEQPPTERELLNRSAQFAFARGRYAQAATLYEAALDQALGEDGAEAIIDARFNLALAQTYLGRHQAALDLVTLAEAERLRRKLGHDPELQLLRATIHYRAGDPAAAQRALDPLVNDPALSPLAAAKVRFLAGVMAADRSDALAVRRYRDALPAGAAGDEQADRLELDARLVALEGDAQGALLRLDRLMALRRVNGDFRGMVRALVVAGTIAERAGHVELAGGYWLRAGRSGAQRGEPDAREWLKHARAIGERVGDAGLILEVDTMLTELGAAQASQ